MFSSIKDWLFTRYTRAINSIAYSPVIISLSLGVLSIVLFIFKYGAANKMLEELIPAFKYLDAEASRSLLSVITAGSISITVFSFSMVMLVLNQASNNYSPKVLDGLVKDKRPQRILGVYIGTVVFCMPHLLLVSNDEQISSLAILLAIILGVSNMFIFIGFIDYVSRSVKPAEICKRIFDQATERPFLENALGGDATLSEKEIDREPEWKTERAYRSGYFQGISLQRLHDICVEHKLIVKLRSFIGSYILKGSTLFYYHSDGPVEEETLQSLHRCFIFYSIEDIDKNPYYAYRQLSEVAVKAMSPGINDVGTARIAVEFLVDLLSQFAGQPSYKTLRDAENKVRVVLQPITLNHLFEICLDEVRLYSREDKNVMLALLRGCVMLMDRSEEDSVLSREVKTFSQKILDDLQSEKHLDDTHYLLEYYHSHLKHYLT